MDNSIYYQAYNAVTDALKVTYNNTVLISDSVARGYFMKKYSAFTIPNLVDFFSLYNSMQSADLSRALTAWNATYNPLDNYNGEEKRIVIDSHGKETDTRETDDEHNTTTTRALDGTKTDTSITTNDDLTPKLENRVENVGGTETVDDVKTINTHEYDETTLTIDGDNYTAHDVHGEIMTKKGNLGVTTSQQMIMSEVDMRLNPLIKQYLDRFIFEYAFYTGGAWGCYY